MTGTAGLLSTSGSGYTPPCTLSATPVDMAGEVFPCWCKSYPLVLPQSSPLPVHFLLRAQAGEGEGWEQGRLIYFLRVYWLVLSLQPVSPEELGVSGVKGRPQVVDHTHT